MRIALAADEVYPVHGTLRRLLEERGHEVEALGAVASGREESWAEVAERAASRVASGACDEAIVLCWSGTGISMAANKVAGVRAALCTDAGTAAAARVWNHANVLCLSHRLLTDDLAKEILAAWLDTERGDRGTAGVEAFDALDRRHRKETT